VQDWLLDAAREGPVDQIPHISWDFLLSFTNECNTVAASAEKIGVTVSQVEQVCCEVRKAKMVNIGVGGLISLDLSGICIRFELLMEVNVSESPLPNDGPFIDAQNVRQVEQHETIPVASLWEMSRADDEGILRRIDLYVKSG
jgi:hypothetical protein